MKSLDVASGFKETETEMTDQLLLPPRPYAITPPCPSMLLYQPLKTPIQKSAAHLYTDVKCSRRCFRGLFLDLTWALLPTQKMQDCHQQLLSGAGRAGMCLEHPAQVCTGTLLMH